MFHVVFFARSLKVTQGRLYLVPFLRYSASNNGVKLKSELGVVQTSRSFKKVPLETYLGTVSFSHSIVTMALSCINQFGDKARYWPKIAIFFIPPAFDAPVMGVPVGIFSYRLVWLPR